MDIDVVITGDTRVTARFAEWPAELHGASHAKIADMVSVLEDRVRALVPVRTGKLRSEIVSLVWDDPDHIRGVVTIGGNLPSAEYAKAGALEYGAPGKRGASQVAGYQRTIGQVFGRAVDALTIEVGAHSRVARLDAMMFFRGGLAQVEPQATAELQSVIDAKAGDFDP